jgi:hypothetical protein
MIIDELDSEENNESILETNIANDYLSSDSMTIGELADQKQQTNRTVSVSLIFYLFSNRKFSSRSMILRQEKKSIHYQHVFLHSNRKPSSMEKRIVKKNPEFRSFLINSILFL